MGLFLSQFTYPTAVLNNAHTKFQGEIDLRVTVSLVSE